jgi:hypothetical protein
MRLCFQPVLCKFRDWEAVGKLFVSHACRGNVCVTFKVQQNWEDFANGISLIAMETGVVFDARIQKPSVVLQKLAGDDFQRVAVPVHI